jgi:outer membrane receptor protein involved in Fe transport
LQTFEAALGFAHPNLRLNANYFLTLVRDMMVLAPAELTNVDRAFSTYMNALDIDIYGVEVEGQATWRDHTFFVNYTYQSPKVKETGERLADVPSHLANLGVSAAIGPYVRLTPTLRIRSSRPRAEGDTRDTSPAYALVNVTFFVHNFFHTLALSGLVYNVFNTSYSDPAPISTVPEDYPRPGRSVFIKATYQF